MFYFVTQSGMTSEIECQVVVILIVIAPMAMLPDGMGLSLVQYKMDV